MERTTQQHDQQSLSAAPWDYARSNSNGLKRTISKCSMGDARFARSDSSSDGGAALKRLAQVAGAAAAAPTTSMDHSEAVLLPRRAHGGDRDEPEGSPPMVEWHTTNAVDSPAAMDDRYYESLMDATLYASPSPHHTLYAATPSDRSNNASTVSLDATMALTPNERECLSPATLHAVLLDYFREVFAYYSRAKGFTFQQLAQSLLTAQSSFRYIQGTVKARLGITWDLVASFVEHVLDFISDEDIRDATVLEFACFLRDVHDATLARVLPTDNIFANLFAFFRDVLEQFKRYLTKLWLQLRRINFPCEFGKKSDTLFLCMECHREHL